MAYDSSFNNEYIKQLKSILSACYELHQCISFIAYVTKCTQQNVLHAIYRVYILLKMADQLQYFTISVAYFVLNGINF